MAKRLYTFSTKKKHVTVEENVTVEVVVDQEAICAWVIGLLMGQSYLNIEQVLYTELTGCLSTLFDAEGQMRVTTIFTLKKITQVEESQRLIICLYTVKNNNYVVLNR